MEDNIHLRRLLGELTNIMKIFGAKSDESRDFIRKHAQDAEFKRLALTLVLLGEANERGLLEEREEFADDGATDR